MTLEERVREAVRRGHEAMQKASLLTFDEESESNPRPPASPDQVHALEQRMRRPLPPSYRAFLEQHDGWLGYTGGAMLLPTEEHDAPWVSKRQKAYRDHFAEFFDVGLLQDAFFVMMGEDEPNFVFMDLAKPTGGGEFEVVHFDMIVGELGRYASFIEYLEAKARTCEELAEETENE